MKKQKVKFFNVQRIVTMILLGVNAIILCANNFIEAWEDFPSFITMFLVFLEALLLYNEFNSYFREYSFANSIEHQNRIKEHDTIKGAIELYRDIEKNESVVNFEGQFVKQQKSDGIEIWVISNCVDEEEDILQKIYDNIVYGGVKYYYVIPHNEQCVNNLNIVSEKLKEMARKKRCQTVPIFRYIQDDLFDFMPTDIVDIIYYYSPNAIGYLKKLKAYYCVQDNRTDGERFYKPAQNNNEEVNDYISQINKWHERQWTEL